MTAPARLPRTRRTLLPRIGAPLRRTGRELLYALSGPLPAVLAAAWALPLLAGGSVLLVTFLGVPLLAASLLGCRAAGRLERARARRLLGLDVPDPEPVRSADGRPRPATGAAARAAAVTAVLRSAASWRHLLYVLLHLPWALCSFALTVLPAGYGLAALLYPAWQWTLPRCLGQPGVQWPGTPDHGGRYLDSPVEVTLTGVAGLVLLPAALLLVRALNRVDRLLVRGLLGPSRLEQRVTELEWDRTALAEAAATDLRRIERDLHDGAQARLVALAMQLGRAKERLPGAPEEAERLVRDAHEEAKLALRELRDLARGIHPAILTDRGLPAALGRLATRCSAHVTVASELPARPAPAVEATAYYTVSELLQNVSKHSGARTAHVELGRAGHRPGRLLLTVTDDGAGGADPARGGGLAGLADRLRSVDGSLAVSSPPGGPTRVTAQLPWRDRETARRPAPRAAYPEGRPR